MLIQSRTFSVLQSDFSTSGHIHATFCFTCCVQVSLVDIWHINLQKICWFPQRIQLKEARIFAIPAPVPLLLYIFLYLSSSYTKNVLALMMARQPLHPLGRYRSSQQEWDCILAGDLLTPRPKAGLMSPPVRAFIHPWWTYILVMSLNACWSYCRSNLL